MLFHQFMPRGQNYGANLMKTTTVKNLLLCGIKKNVRRSKKTLNYDVTPASDPSFTNVTEFERGRKRKRQEENWERSRKKKLRNSGQSYSPYKCFPNRKTSMKTRSMGIPCSIAIQKYQRRVGKSYLTLIGV